MQAGATAAADFCISTGHLARQTPQWVHSFPLTSGTRNPSCDHFMLMAPDGQKLVHTPHPAQSASLLRPTFCFITAQIVHYFQPSSSHNSHRWHTHSLNTIIVRIFSTKKTATNIGTFTSPPAFWKQNQTRRNHFRANASAAYTNKSPSTHTNRKSLWSMHEHPALESNHQQSHSTVLRLPSFHLCPGTHHRLHG